MPVKPGMARRRSSSWNSKQAPAEMEAPTDLGGGGIGWASFKIGLMRRGSVG